jgi:hypothetical protein
VGKATSATNGATARRPPLELPLLDDELPADDDAAEEDPAVAASWPAAAVRLVGWPP